MAKKPHCSPWKHYRRAECIPRLRVDPKFATMLIKASKGASVRMPNGLTGSEIIEWISLSWEEAVRRDPTFCERTASVSDTTIPGRRLPGRH